MPDSEAVGPSAEEVAAALETVRILQRRDPLAFVKSNLFQQRLYRAVQDPKPQSLTVVLALKPNRVGGTFGLVNLWKAIMWGSENPLFQASPFGAKWPFLKSARILSISECLADGGALQVAMRAAFPRGRYEQNRGVGKGYNSAGRTDTGWDWDAFSYGQDALSAAGATKGLVMVSEPPPKPLFVESITRISGNGLMVIECVQLDLAPWLERMARDAGGEIKDGIQYGTLRLEGKTVGEVRVVRGDIEDACAEHSNGHMSHTAIEAMVASWPSEEREARSRGVPLHLSGSVYPTWGPGNEIKALPEWHQQQWDEGNVIISSIIDPADRKPWACLWTATFQNEDVIAICEWPPFNYHECKSSPVVKIESYRDVLLEVEAQIGIPVRHRIIDGLFGEAIKSGKGKSIIQMLSDPCEGCEEKHGAEASRLCPHKLSYRRAPAYKGSVRDGHIMVREWIGDATKGARPKLMSLIDYTPNFCFGMVNYAYRENLQDHKGLSEVPQLVFKDWPDCARMGLQSGIQKWPVEPLPAKIIPREPR